MIDFTVYNSVTGEIKNSGTCLDISIQLVEDGFSLLQIASNPTTQYIKNNLLKNIPKKPSGEYEFNYVKEQWEPCFDKQCNLILKERNAALSFCDWTQIPNNPLTSEKQEEWAVYRQQLRDVTSQSGYPFNVVWPTQPE